MPKPTREVDWQARPDLPENPYTEYDLGHIVEAIEEGAMCKLSPAEGKRLLRRVRWAARMFITATYQRQGPTHGQIKDALSELHTAADKLLGVVRALDDATLFALLRQRGEFAEAYWDAQAQNQSFEKTRVRALGIISALSKEAKAAVEEVGKPYPPPDENLLYWIIDWVVDPIYRDETPVTKFVFGLADIFNEITGENPVCTHIRAGDKYSGNFLPFVDACLSPLEGKRRRALGKTVHTALSKWRDARDARA